MRVSIRHASMVAAILLSACGGGEESSNSSSNAASNRETATAATKLAAAQASSVSKSVLAKRLAVPSKITAAGKIDPRLSRASGQVEVWVSLDQTPLATYKSAKLAEQGIEMQPRRIGSAARTLARSVATPAERAMRTGLQSQRGTVLAQQSSVLGQLKGMGARELGSVKVAHNAVAVKVNAASLATIAQLPGVVKVRPVMNYKLDLSETVPYVGAAAAQAAGKDGTGVRVAVLDSGIDYTHKNLGGPGTLAAYAAAAGTSPGDPKGETRDGLFPTAKVIGGYDFVGDVWPNGDRTEDPDPIDYQGHGTHVGDIIAGRSADGKHKGVAPGASLIAIKVCSSVATSCNGVALLKAVDYALDPNGDGSLDDAVDVMNLSLGQDYGQIEDDLTLALSQAVDLGVVVVASAGNGANKPYILGSPSMAPGVISVAQTQVPSAKAYPLIVNTPASIAGSYGNTETAEWAPVGSGFSGGFVFVGKACPGDPLLANPAGKIALIDRGTCAVSLKVDVAAKAGAKGVLIGLVAPGDAVSFSYGGGDSFVPMLVIQQSLSNKLKANPTATVTLSPAAAIALVGSMASTSSRGPDGYRSLIKPEIGAPGASVSAQVGTGDGQTAFGGTSGAAPMVSGAAAIMVQAHPELSPYEIKALLMNSAETKVYTSQALLPGDLAPISRIGAGELRVDRALALDSLVRNVAARSASLSFGFQDVAGTTLLERKLRIQNLGDTDKYYSVQSSFRHADDAASKAVRLIAPSKVFVRAHGKEDITVALFIDGRRLPDWPFSGNPALIPVGAALDGPEYDGYVTFTAGTDKISVPWHVLPRKASEMSVAAKQVKAGKPIHLHNDGFAAGEFDLFALTGVSPKSDLPIPEPGSNEALIDLRAVGVRASDTDDVLQFAINTFRKRPNPNYPAEFDVYIDVNRDGVDDFVVYNAELGGPSTSGINAVYVVNLADGTGAAYYYADADLQSGNVILSAPLSVMGITSATTFDFTVYAFDNYFTGVSTDNIGPMTFTPAKPKFAVTSVLDGTPLAKGDTLDIKTAAVSGGAAASPSQSGFLLMYRHDIGRETDIVRVK